MSDTRELTSEERDRASAEAEKHRAEARKFVAEAEEAEHGAAVAKIERERAVEKRRREQLADDYDHHRYAFYGQVDATSVLRCISQLKAWHREDSACPIEIAFFSPGGAVFPGMELFDYITDLRATHEITTSASGYAASMAGILLQAGTVRAMTRESYVMVHEISSGAGGKVSEIEDEVEFLKKVGERVLGIFAERAAATGRPKAISKTRLRRLSTRKDCWLSSQECFDYGIVDEVR